MVCCLFGHRDAPVHIRPLLEQVLGQLITEYRADTMMVGQQGAFDRMASGVLRHFCRQYPFLKCCEVLAYPPREKREKEALQTILPEGDRMCSAKIRYCVAQLLDGGSRGYRRALHDTLPRRNGSNPRVRHAHRQEDNQHRGNIADCRMAQSHLRQSASVCSIHFPTINKT